MTLFVLAITAIHECPKIVTAGCSEHWLGIQHKCYFITDGTLSYSQAIITCEKMGGSLTKDIPKSTVIKPAEYWTLSARGCAYATLDYKKMKTENCNASKNFICESPYNIYFNQ